MLKMPFLCYLIFFWQSKVVVHVDPTGGADDLEFGIRGPFLVIRVQPLEGELSRYSIFSQIPGEVHEGDIVHSPTVPARIIDTSTFQRNIVI
jgi:protein ECT2